MPRVKPIDYATSPADVRAVHDDVVAEHGRVTNMKMTLLRSMPAFRALNEWYPLHDTVVPFLGERLTTLFSHAISTETDCLICSTFFRRLLIDAGENPDDFTARRPRARRRRATAARSRSRPRRRDRRAVRPAGGAVQRGADRRADGVRRDDGRHQRVQQRARSRPRRATCEPYRRGRHRAGTEGRRWRTRVRGQGRLRHRRRARAGARHGAGAGARDGAHIAALDVARPLAYPGYAMGIERRPARPAGRVPRRGRRLPDVRGRRPRRRGRHGGRATRRSTAFGRIDVLFNNAGICAYGLAHELTEDAWDAMLDINLKGAWLVAPAGDPAHDRAAFGRDHQQLVGRRPARHGPAEPLRGVEVGPDRPDEVVGDRAGAARHPRRLDPPDRRQHADERRPRRARGPTPHEIAERSAGNLLPVPWIEPEDVAEAVLFLASDRARFVTGLAVRASTPDCLPVSGHRKTPSRARRRLSVSWCATRLTARATVRRRRRSA